MSEKAKQGRPFIDLKEKAKGISLEDEFYTIEELSKILKVEHKTIRRAIQRGEIKAMKIGKQWRIKKSDIQ